jgi:hypothetical protein
MAVTAFAAVEIDAIASPRHVPRRRGVKTTLKIIANSGAYGVLAEMNVRDRTPKDPTAVYGLATFDTDETRRKSPVGLHFRTSPP